MSIKSRKRYWELKNARREAHVVFDRLWIDGLMSRSGAYRWLSEATEIPRDECHFRLFDVGLCEAVTVLARRKYRRLNKIRQVRRKRSRESV